MIHVAILLKPYLDLVLDGQKTIESRLTKTARAPFRAIESGERIYFKQSSGPFRATAVVGRVRFFDELTPARVRQLRRNLNHHVCGDDTFWRSKSGCRFATFIELEAVEAVRRGPTLQPQRGVAWISLSDDRDVYPSCLEGAAYRREAPIVLSLTAGAIRRRYLNVRPVLDRFPADALGGSTRANAGRPIALKIPGGPTIVTDIVKSRGFFRTRSAWGAWFEREQARPGDAVVLQRVGPRSYLLTLDRRSALIGSTR